MKQRNGSRILAWALGGSLALHLTFAVAVHTLPVAAADDTQAPQRVTIEHPPHRQPTPSPTQPPHRVIASAPIPARRPIHVAQTHLVVAHARANGPVEAAPGPDDPYFAPGPDQLHGDPGPATPPTPTPTPKPACSDPNVAAQAVDPVSPSIPDDAEGQSGTAQVQVTLSPTGSVETAAIYRSTGVFSLDREALSAARMTRYRPEVRDCVPVGGNYLFTVTFQS